MSSSCLLQAVPSPVKHEDMVRTELFLLMVKNYEKLFVAKALRWLFAKHFPAPWLLWLVRVVFARSSIPLVTVGWSLIIFVLLSQRRASFTAILVPLHSPTVFGVPKCKDLPTSLWPHQMMLRYVSQMLFLLAFLTRYTHLAESVVIQ